MTALSYSVAVTPINTVATSLAVAPPPAYQAGDLLVMGVAGSTAAGAGVSANTPSGWVRRSAAGSILSVFVKTATSSEPASYTVTMASSCQIEAYTAAFPAATVASSTFSNSAAGSLTYSPTFPSGITSGQTVLVAAAALTSTGAVNAPVGNSNFNFPAAATVEVPAVSAAQPDTGPYAGAIGLCSVPGSAATGTALFNSGQQCTFYAGFLVLNVTGAANTLTVSATVPYPEGLPGLALTVKALSGAAAPAAILAGGATSGYYADGTSGPPQAAITPNASGSLVYGAVTANFDVTAGTSYTAATGTTFSQNIADSYAPAMYGTLRSTGTTTAGAPLTLGASAPANDFFTAVLAEVTAAPGSTLAETATAAAHGVLPGDFATWTVTQSATFRTAPAQGSLLVATVSANSNWDAGHAAVTITDTAGLTWLKLAELSYPSYSGVWVAQIVAVPAYEVLDEGGGAVLDEAGNNVYDESAPGGPAAPFAQPHKARAGRRSARRGTSAGSAGAPYTFVPVIPAPFAQPHKVAERHPDARKGLTAGSPGAAYVYVPVIPAPFSQPGRGIAGNASARHGTAQGSPGAPYTAVSPYLHYVILDEGGGPVLDEGGGLVYDESGPGPLPGSPAWSAARAGLPGDDSAVNWAQQVSQFLVSQGVTPVYQGNRTWTTALPSAPEVTAFSWLDDTTAGWLPRAAVSQPFTLPAGSTTVGRVQVPVLPSGNGADLQVTLAPDNGSGKPNLATVLATITIPAAHINAACATGSLATAAGPLSTARGNTCYPGPVTTATWAQPALSANGAGSFATPATSGGFTAFIGGYDSVANAAIGTVSVVASQGGAVSTGVTQPPLPQAAWFTSAAITTDSVVVAGGRNLAGLFSSVWTASWDAPTGTIGAWSAQTALPAPLLFSAMASWGTTVYVIGGTTSTVAAQAVSTVYMASVSSGQVTAWTAGPPLPAKTTQAYAAVVGNWLVVAGGQTASSTFQSTVWYSAINSDGSLAGWQQGPPLAVPACAFAPGWNLAVTDSAMIIAAGPTTGGANSPYTQVLTVSADGPADAWQLANWGAGDFQAAAYPAAGPGQWQLFQLGVNAYFTSTLSPVPLLSVPLPASGLTPGATYHVVMRQSGGGDTDSLQVGVVSSTGTGWLHEPVTGGAWTSVPGQQVAMNVSDQTPGGPVYHLVTDSDAGLATLVWSGGDSTLLGVMESAVFPAGAPEAVLPAVTQVTWNDGLPSGLVPLA